MAFVADNAVIVAWFVPSQATEPTRKAWRLGIEVHETFRALAPLIDVVRRHAIKAYDAPYLHVSVSIRATRNCGRRLDLQE